MSVNLNHSFPQEVFDFINLTELMYVDACTFYEQVDTPTIFLICGIVGLLGAVLTVFFSVDLTHVSLSEHDAQFEFALEGRPEDYKGKLNKKEHLSLFERMTGKHGEYDPKWAKAFEKSEDPAYVEQHELPIDYFHYFENKFSTPVSDLLEPLVEGDAKREIFGEIRGQHRPKQ